jgi:hypothetical protein
VKQAIMCELGLVDWSQLEVTGIWGRPLVDSGAGSGGW